MAQEQTRIARRARLGRPPRVAVRWFSCSACAIPRPLRRFQAHRDPKRNPPFVLRSAAVAPALLAAAYAVILLWRLPADIAALAWNSDAVSPAVIVEGYRPDGGATVLGDISSATTLALDWALMPLPSHRQLWSMVPVVVALAGVATLTWSVGRVGGRQAAATASVVVIAVPPTVLLTYLAPAFHGTTWAAVAVLAAALVFLAGPPHRGPLARTLVPLAVGVFAGSNVVADPLLVPAGLAPFALAALLIGWKWRPFIWSCGMVLLAALLTAVTLAVAMAHADIVPRRRLSGSASLLVVTSPHEIVHRLAQLPEAAAALVAPTAAWASAVVALAAVAAVALLRGTRGSGAAADAARGGFLAFWILSSGFVVGAYLLSGSVSSEGTPGQHARYLVPLLYSLAALGGLWASTSPRHQGFAALVVALYGIGNIAALPGSGFADQARRGALRSSEPALEAWLVGRGVTRGYAGYWDANVLRYRNRLDVMAVAQCDDGGQRTLCPDLLNTRQAWYAPVNRPTFLIVDPTPGGAHVVSTMPPPTRFGGPVATKRFGALTVAIYPYDIASRLAGPWGPGTATSPGERQDPETTRMPHPKS